MLPKIAFKYEDKIRTRMPHNRKDLETANGANKREKGLLGLQPHFAKAKFRKHILQTLISKVLRDLRFSLNHLSR
jgi:hypothetical protein